MDRVANLRGAIALRPIRQDIGDRMVFSDGNNFDLGDQFFAAADGEFATFQHALFGSDIDKNEI